MYSHNPGSTHRRGAGCGGPMGAVRAEVRDDREVEVEEEEEEEEVEVEVEVDVADDVHCNSSAIVAAVCAHRRSGLVSITSNFTPIDRKYLTQPTMRRKRREEEEKRKRRKREGKEK